MLVTSRLHRKLKEGARNLYEDGHSKDISTQLIVSRVTCKTKITEITISVIKKYNYQQSKPWISGEKEIRCVLFIRDRRGDQVRT